MALFPNLKPVFSLMSCFTTQLTITMSDKTIFHKIKYSEAIYISRPQTTALS